MLTRIGRFHLNSERSPYSSYLPLGKRCGRPLHCHKRSSELTIILSLLINVKQTPKWNTLTGEQADAASDQQWRQTYMEVVDTRRARSMDSRMVTQIVFNRPGSLCHQSVSEHLTGRRHQL